ncbi:hypothetical protein Ddye_031947 [Dipteronia dyeriana]|uniref:DC1 domain-containing protein n=1 Tax=Dipteronia dyeriana TaxID=168575 RepID=A0AAD9TJA2_9ROSI|nr:hypothetical protein Ddye_031941 [Dipteronia dyeriana]KAK2637155.1 hypothetical protein Ddye_031947 [Dipteronia dyeriana]
MATAFSQKRSNRPAVKHISHCHALCPFNAKEEDEIICSGCELDLKNSSAFKCTKSECDFFLHKECFQLPREVQHKFHPDHPLKLLFNPPYSEVASLAMPVVILELLLYITVPLASMISMLVVLICLKS